MAVNGETAFLGPGSVIYLYFFYFLLFSHLADAFIQSDLQIRKLTTTFQN